ETHLVNSGETLRSIALQYGSTVIQLYRNNPQLHALPDITAGEELVISFDQQKEGTLSVNGYAYPFVNRTLFRETMPYLTYMAPFTYGFTEEGDLIDLNDISMISLSLDYGVAPLMHLSTLTEDGGFSNELAHVALTDSTVQQTLIKNIRAMLRKKNYTALDVDFEFVFPEDQEAYAAFIKNLSTLLNPLGYEVIVALAPKTSADQKGLLYEGHNFKLLGEAANAVLLMTYEWGYTYGPPMAVAPINKVREVLDYAVTEIAPKKIFLGMPNYGYDWTLPFVQGTSKADSISNVEAVDLARKYGESILYNEKAQSPYFQYWDEFQKKHEVWFEDARSIQAKLALIPEYGFQGVGYWNLMRPFPQNWSVLNALYRIRHIL
ncbi:MAG: glycosyl hydrolase family 18 protein, partial [Oscillospiraceae bacterium]